MVVLHEKMRENHALYFHIYCVKVVCVVSTHILCEKHASFFTVYSMLGLYTHALRYKSLYTVCYVKEIFKLGLPSNRLICE